MCKSEGAERRNYPRARVDFTVKLSDKEFGVITRAENISCSGVNYVVNKFMPLYTKVSLTLFIPLSKGKGVTVERLHCEGVVVRIDPMPLEGQKSAYRVAVFFSDTGEKNREKIARYVEERY